MSTTRSLAAAAASALMAAALVLGAALPTQAAPILPTPGPIIPGPVLPVPLPLSYFSIPSCADMVPATAITATRVRYPSFGAVANVPGLLGAQNATLVSVINAHAGARTCSFGTGSAQVIVTETAITAAEYKIIKYWYDRNASSSRPGGGPVWGGGTLDTHYVVGSIATPSGPGPSEVATISPNGWWITVRDAGRIGALPYLQMDTVRQFFALNPRLALITR